MTDLADFLLARIAEDEAAARGQIDLRAARYPDELDLVNTADGYQVDRGWWLHAEPTRVLAECEAKRRIVEAEPEWWVRQPDAPGFTVDMGCPEGMVRVYGKLMTEDKYRDRYMELAPPSQTLLHLALPYADHPDYREEWRT